MIPALPVAVAILLSIQALALPWATPPSRQRTLLLHLTLVAAAWSLVGALFWQGVPILAPVYLALGLVLAWLGWKLMVAVCQVELRRRLLLWVGRCGIALLILALALTPEDLVKRQNALVWSGAPVLEVLLGSIFVIFFLALAELVRGMFSVQDRRRVAPWLVVWALLISAVAAELAAGAAGGLGGVKVPPVGSALVLLAAFVALVLSVHRGGPFPLQGEIPRAAFARARDAVLLVDGAQRIQAVSAAAQDLLGAGEAALLGRRIQRVLPGMPENSKAWEAPLWLSNPDRSDGGIWISGGDLYPQKLTGSNGGRESDGEPLARLLHLRGGNVAPSVEVGESWTRMYERRWLQGAEVMPGLHAALRRYGMGRQFVAAAVHLTYRWDRVQQEVGDAALDELLQLVAERLLTICDWNVECFRLQDGQFVLLMSDLTGPEEAQKLIARAQTVLAEPWIVAGKRLSVPLQLAVVPDLRLYRRVDEWLEDADVALKESRGECVTVSPRAEHRNRLMLALEHSLMNDGISWWGEPVLNLTTQQVAAWRLQPRWTPEDGVCWEGKKLYRATTSIHLQRCLYGMARSLRTRWPAPIWLEVPLEDLALAKKSLGDAVNDGQLVLELDRLDPAFMAAQGIRATDGFAEVIAPVASGRGFASPLKPKTLRLDTALAAPGLSSDMGRQAMVRGCRGAVRVRDQRLYAAGVVAYSDLLSLRELGVDYASGAAVGPLMSLKDAQSFRYKPLK